MRWKKWAKQKSEVTVFPAGEVHFALYLQHLGETIRSKSAIEEALNAISWAHQLAGHPPINTFAFVHATVAGLQRKLAKPKANKKTVSTDMLIALVDSLGSSPSLSEVRLAAGALVRFFCSFSALFCKVALLL